MVAGLLRLLLPVRRVGFLAVRSRPVDVVLLAGVGAAVVAVALAIPADAAGVPLLPPNTR
jgi:hypothetical protein